MADIFNTSKTENPKPAFESLGAWLSNPERLAYLKDHDRWMSERGFIKYYGNDGRGHIISWWERKSC